MTWKIIHGPDIAKELQNIHSFILQESEDVRLADRTLRAITSALLSLDTMPLRHRLYPDDELEKREIRYLVSGSYVIFFAVNESDKTVRVHHILHGYQLPNNDG